MRKAAIVQPAPHESLGNTTSEPVFGKPHTRTYTLPEQIAEHIADAIIAGTYPPGSWLSEQELANLFGVSRGPIRDALRLLEHEKLVQILPRRGTMVTRLTREQVQDIFRIRASLMALAARLTTERKTPAVDAELTSFAALLDQTAHGDDSYAFLGMAYRISNFLAESSLNIRLQEMILSMARQTLPLTRMSLALKENRKLWAQGWRAISQAILAGDANAAEVAAHGLITQTGNQAAEFAPGSRDAMLGENHRSAIRLRPTI